MEAIHSDPRTSVAAGDMTLLERGFPFIALSHVINADRRVHDPVYGAHRWWARRPPSLLRAALLSAILSPDTTAEEFWQLYSSPGTPLAGLRVHDPFLGGGSTVVEAARLGAAVSGGDVDPLAVELVRYELNPAPPGAIREASAALLSHLEAAVGHMYPRRRRASTPLHYFWVHEVTCPTCGVSGLLYRDLVLARDRRKVGAVVRDRALTVFCPEDLSVHEFDRADRVLFRHKGRSWRIADGTYRGTRYFCGSCGTASTHKQLATGVAPRSLVGVEDTEPGVRRRIRAATKADLTAVDAAATWVEAHRAELNIPSGPLTADRHDDRPRSFGMTNVLDLFTDRQLAVLGAALQWITDANVPDPVRAGLRLGLSNALATNNKLCSYAYDYGRLSALFSVRGYSLPALAVELNPLHPDGGRGTLHHCFERVARSGDTNVRRHSWSVDDENVTAVELALDSRTRTTNVACAPASKSPPAAAPQADICFFDPPYFDYIAYSELSEFHRAWLQLPGPSVAPLLPDGDDPGESFGLQLGTALRATLARLAPGRPLAFTYHSTHPEAWRAIGIALDEAKLRVTALWPVRSDGHMGHHSHPGNCEWDLVMVCRRLTETNSSKATLDVERWAQAAEPLTIGTADRRSMKLAIEVASSRFGTIAKGIGA